MRAKLLLTACLIPALLAADPAFAESSAPARTNFGPAPTPRVIIREQPEIGGFFAGLFGQRRVEIAEFADLPEVSNKDPDQGFENYQPEPKLALADASLSGASLFNPLSGAVLNVLKDEAGALQVRASEKQAVLNLYLGRNFAPAWVNADGITAQGKAVLAKLGLATEDGLEPRDYLPPGLENFEADGASLKGDDAGLARLDVAISAMAAKFAHELHSGRIVPRRLSGYYDIDQPQEDLDALMKELADAADPAAVLASAAPPFQPYQALKAELARQREAAVGAPEPMPEGPRVKPGQKDARILALRQRMLADGFVKEAPASWSETLPEGDEAVLDAPLSEALKEFQKKNAIKVTGALDAATVTALNGGNARQKINTLVLNMERLRWLPRDLGERYVIANQPAFELRLMENGAEAWRTRVIIGKPSTQTFVFNEEMETVVFNPTWGVPQSIIVNEMLPELQRDPAYLDRMGYQVSDRNGNIIPSSRIDWSSFGRAVPLNVVQPAGGDNALGEVKFLFPNAHNIYMHDTPNRKLFNDSVRAFSHGCVRVQNPRRYAELLLGWSEDQVAKAIAAGNTQNVQLEQKIPVYLHYFTAYADPDGSVSYYADIYNRDAKLARALQSLVQLAQN